MAVTINPRPTVFGDRMIITGTYAAGDNSIDFSSFLSEIDFAGANSSGVIAGRAITDTGASPPLQNVHFGVDVRIDGTTIRLAAGLQDPGDVANTTPAQAGTFIAIGRRS